MYPSVCTARPSIILAGLCFNKCIFFLLHFVEALLNTVLPICHSGAGKASSLKANPIACDRRSAGAQCPQCECGVCARPVRGLCAAATGFNAFRYDSGGVIRSLFCSCRAASTTSPRHATDFQLPCTAPSATSGLTVDEGLECPTVG